MDAAVLLVVAAVEVAAPAPFLGTDDESCRIDGLDLLREVDRLVADLAHRRRRGPDVAMRGVPDARLVVEDVVAQAAVRVRAPATDQVLDPALLQERCRGDVGVVRIVAGHELTVGADAVTGIGKPLPVGPGLRAVLGDREAGELGPIGADLGDPFDHRHRQHGLGIGRPRVGDEGIAALAGRRARLGDALVVPVVAAVVGVQLPVVARGVVAAVAIERAVEVVQLGGARVRHAVDVGIDRTAVDVGVDRNGDRRILRGCRRAVEEQHTQREDSGVRAEIEGFGHGLVWTFRTIHAA